MPSPFRGARAASLAALALVLASCSSAGADPAPSTTPAASSAEYPITVDNCGYELTVTQPPQRIVTVKSSTTELVLALGLGEHLIGTAFLDGPLPDDLAAAGAAVPELADKAPSSEVVLAAEPDFIFAGWESTFAADGVGERSELSDLGIATYVPPAACQEEAYAPEHLTFDDVFADIEQAGQVLGAPQAAADLVAQQQAALDAVQPSTDGYSALWYSSGSDTPYVGGGTGAPQMIMEAAGLTNIAADVPSSWGSVGWETVVAAEPDVIVLVDSQWNTAEHKIQVLQDNPVTANLAAVQQGRYLIVPFAATEAGIRNVEAAASLTQQLAELDG